MKIILLTVAALLAAGPASALTKVNVENEAARVAAERGDAWHVKRFGPVSLPPMVIAEEAPAGSLPVPTSVGTVPEPASWALMLGGFGLIGGAMRRRSMARVTA